MSWCGRYAGGWGSPCRLEVVLASVFFLVACLVVTFQLRRLRILRSRVQGLDRSRSYVSAALGGIYIISALRHLAWLLALSILKESAGFQIFFEAFFFASWALILVSPHITFSLSHAEIDTSFVRSTHIACFPFCLPHYTLCTSVKEHFPSAFSL